MKTNKIRVIQDYEKLNEDIKEQIKLVYPEGFSQHLIEFTNSKGEKVSALPFETFEKVYMIRMSIRKADQIIRDDIDYDDEGFLKENSKEKYEDKYDDIDYLSENENYEEEVVDDGED